MTAHELPPAWHNGPDDSFHGKITADGPFKPEKDRYHLYIGLFCPFAHRPYVVRHIKQLERYAGLDVSVVKPYPKGDGGGSWPGWQFNLQDDEGTDHWYPGATVDKIHGKKFMHELYFRADKEYKGKYSVPVLWDKKLDTIVNNESHELLHDLQTAFDTLLPQPLVELTLYPAGLSAEIDTITEWIQAHFNTGVYKAGFATTQQDYERALPQVFASLNKLEKVAHRNGGPFILGQKHTEIDVRAYATIVRFDTVYHQHFKCNLGLIRYNYPVLNNWLKNLYWNHAEYHETTDFKHIKENYTKSHDKINPLHITPVGPWPCVEQGYEADWSKLRPGSIDMPEVLEFEKQIP